MPLSYCLARPISLLRTTGWSRSQKESNHTLGFVCGTPFGLEPSVRFGSLRSLCLWRRSHDKGMWLTGPSCPPNHPAQNRYRISKGVYRHGSLRPQRGNRCCAFVRGHSRCFLGIFLATVHADEAQIETSLSEAVRIAKEQGSLRCLQAKFFIATARLTAPRFRI